MHFELTSRFDRPRDDHVVPAVFFIGNAVLMRAVVDSEADRVPDRARAL
jgi:hypothetical protein